MARTKGINYPRCTLHVSESRWLGEYQYNFEREKKEKKKHYTCVKARNETKKLADDEKRKIRKRGKKVRETSYALQLISRTIFRSRWYDHSSSPPIKRSDTAAVFVQNFSAKLFFFFFVHPDTYAHMRTYIYIHIHI